MRNDVDLPPIVRALLLACLLLGAVGAARSVPRSGEVVLTGQSDELRVTQGVAVLFENRGEPLAASQVVSPGMAARWEAVTEPVLNLTREARPAWLRFTVRDQSPADRRWVLAVTWPMIDRIDLHLHDPVANTWAPVVRAGIDADAAGRALKDPAFVFPIDLPDGATREVLLRVESHSAYFVPLVIADAARFQARRFDTAVLMGVLFGVIGVMFLYNGVLSLFVRERSYAMYSLYLLSILLYELTVTGYGTMYLWGDSHWLKRHDYEVFASASFLTVILFFRLFIGLRDAQPVHLRWINTGLAWYWGVTLVLSAVWPDRGLLTLSGVMGLVSSFAGVYSSVVLIARGNRYARYFAVAWSMVTVGTVASLLAVLGVIEGGWFTENAQHIGFTLEAVLLSVALADRIKREREGRERAQRKALALTERVKREREEKILAQAQALDAQTLATERLEQRVSDRTAALEQAMKRLEEANAALARLSVTDALTQVHNRRYFDEVMDKEYARSARAGVPLAVVLVDIDHFKRVNDTCGHLAGDECLRQVAAALRRTAGRATDLVARYGGEEFALVLPGSDAAHACELADRVRQAVAGIEFVHRGQRVPISVSLGVVARVTSHHQPVADFIAEADAALYRAKEAGRNRVMLAA